MTDTHVRPGHVPDGTLKHLSDGVLALSGKSTDQRFAEVMAEHLDASVDVLLHTGDVADVPTDDPYEAVLDQFDAWGLPYLMTAGNHDDRDALAASLGAPGRTLAQGSVFDGAVWRVVTVDTTRPEGLLGGEARDLHDVADAAASWGGPVLVGMHHPPISPCAHDDCQLHNADAFFAVVDAHPNIRAVASGHLHLTGHEQRNGVEYFLSPSTGLQLRHVHPLEENNFANSSVGVRSIDLHDDGSVETRVLWTD